MSLDTWGELKDCIYCLLVDGFHGKGDHDLICIKCLDFIGDNVRVMETPYLENFGKKLRFFDHRKCIFHPNYKGNIFFLVPICSDHEMEKKKES